MKINTSRLLMSALMIALFAACSRPVAYLQPSAREHFATAPARTEPVNVSETPSPVLAETPATPAEQLAQASVALNQVDAMVRNDSKLAADKTVQKRLNRVRNLLTTASAKSTMTPTTVNAAKKMNLMERLMLKKMNKKISRQLAPANPDKAMAIEGVLALGAVLVLGGLLLVLLTTGTGATIGVIALAAGLVFLLIGLL
jgi:hypothetical protein